MHMEKSSKNLIRWNTPTAAGYVIHCCCYCCSKKKAAVHPYNHSAFRYKTAKHIQYSIKYIQNILSLIFFFFFLKILKKGA